MLWKCMFACWPTRILSAVETPQNLSSRSQLTKRLLLYSKGWSNICPESRCHSSAGGNRVGFLERQLALSLAAA